MRLVNQDWTRLFWSFSLFSLLISSNKYFTSVNYSDFLSNHYSVLTTVKVSFLLIRASTVILIFKFGRSRTEVCPTIPERYNVTPRWRLHHQNLIYRNYLINPLSCLVWYFGSFNFLLPEKLRIKISERINKDF